tara:strand:- start:126 stop:329 length:204 start_codon:yes stop_codon:yes gene_type:complete
MSMRKSIHFDRQKDQEQPRVFPGVSRVNLNTLMKKLKEEREKAKRNNLAISLTAFSAVVVFGIILTL